MPPSAPEGEQPQARQEPERLPQGPRTDEQILAGFETGDQRVITERLNVLSSLGYHIGKDLQVKMGLTEPGSNLWYQDPVNNEIRADPQQLLEKDMGYLRFAMAHEGGHRRITRTDGISEETLHKPGFAFLLNAVEDPRNNNFILDGYPVLRQNINHIYEHELGFGTAAKERAAKQLGHTPRFMEAGSEYIRQWMRDQRGDPLQVDPDLRPDVRQVVERTVGAAQDRWWTYPSKPEADSGEEMIASYARAANEILQQRIWPEFRQLVEADVRDQAAADELNRRAREGQKAGPDSLSPEEQDELEKALEEAIERAGQGEAAGETAEGEPVVVDFDGLSEGLKDKIREYIDSLPDDQRAERVQAAADTLQEFEKELIEEHEGVSGGHMEEVLDGTAAGPSDSFETEAESELGGEAKGYDDPEQEARLKKIRDTIERLNNANKDPYTEARREVQPIIDRVASDLEAVFVERRAHKWSPGQRSGTRLDITRRMREKGRQVSAARSRSWEQRELPTEKDYVFTILVDLSGSTRKKLAGSSHSYEPTDKGTKIHEMFKSAVVLAEVLDQLKVRTRIVGFNAELHPYKDFNESLDEKLRVKLGKMKADAYGLGSGANSDGYAVKHASDELAAQPGDEKYLIVLSDGRPAPVGEGMKPEYDLTQVIQNVQKDTDQNLVGIGVQSDAVNNYYPIAAVEDDAAQLSLRLAALLQDIVNNPDKYRVK